MDPKSGNNIGSNLTVKKTQDIDGLTEVWLTEAELAGPQYMNSTENA